MIRRFAVSAFRRFGVSFFADSGARWLSTTLAAPLPVLNTDLRLARLRVSAGQIAVKPVLEPNQEVFVKPNFRSLNRAVFGSSRSADQYCTRAKDRWRANRPTAAIDEEGLAFTLFFRKK